MSSRSWERKVRKNQSQLNKQRKKQGKDPLTLKTADTQLEIYKGRSIIMPAFLVLFTALYVILSFSSDAYKTADTMYWVTIGLYLLLAVLFVLRRPYLAVSKEYVRSRRFGGDRNLYASNIKGISVQKGYVVIEQIKGGNWVFSRLINRYPTDEMAERLRAFAAANQITFTDK